MHIQILLTVALGMFAIGTANASYGKYHDRYEKRLAAYQERQATFLDRRYQRSNVIDFDLGFYKGAATLVRSKNRLRGRMMTNVPTAGDPYTLWVLVFNNPEHCTDLDGDGKAEPCGDADIPNPKVNVSIFNGSGAISAANGLGGGVVNMDFDVMAGDLPNDQFVLFQHGNGLHRNKGFRVQVALVVDQHPPIPQGSAPWLDHLTETNDPTEGPATNNAIAVFLPCPQASCPDSPF